MVLTYFVVKSYDDETNWFGLNGENLTFLAAAVWHCRLIILMNCWINTFEFSGYTGVPLKLLFIKFLGL